MSRAGAEVVRGGGSVKWNVCLHLLIGMEGSRRKGNKSWHGEGKLGYRRSCRECAERCIWMEANLYTLQGENGAQPLGGQRMLTQGNRGSCCPPLFSCLGALGLLATSTLGFHPVCLTSLLCLYPCLSLKEIALEHLLQARQSVRARVSFGPGTSGSKSTLLPKSQPSLAISASPYPPF